MGRRELLMVGLAGLVLYGCGSSSAASSGTTTPVTTPATTPTPASTATTNAAGQTTYSYQMPASSKPTACTVTLSGHYATVEFSSDSLDVTPACHTFVQANAASGQLWQEQDFGIGGTSLNLICTLSGSNATVTAKVFDDGGEIYGQEACEQLLSTGSWSETNTAP